jgi:glycosyltransferase involved in cell wall biosynthesis
MWSRTPFAIHTDGKGWQRSKWGRLQRGYYKWSERISARLANWLVADSPSMQLYYEEEYGAGSSYIPYGSRVGNEPDVRILNEFGLRPGGYHLAVARLEPENNVDLLIREHRQSRARLPLVYVGAARYESEHSRAVMAESDERVQCIGAVYDSGRLNALYAHCRSYLHGHEVGGTNPSLLRAMGAGAACVPIDVIYHREAMGEDGVFFRKDKGHLASLIERLEADDALVAKLGGLAGRRAEQLYRWDAVAAAYATLLRRLATRAGRAELARPVYAPGDHLPGSGSAP